jgi:Na+/melibiose symporter-like transporter
MGFTNVVFLVSIQGSVGWERRGAVTSLMVFMRALGQATGAALYGAILNYGLYRRVPGSAGLVDRLMDPVQRHGLAGGEIERLTTAIAGALHEVYWVTGALAVATLLAALRIPLGLKPARGGPAR